MNKTPIYYLPYAADNKGHLLLPFNMQNAPSIKKQRPDTFEFLIHLFFCKLLFSLTFFYMIMIHSIAPCFVQCRNHPISGLLASYYNARFISTESR